MGGNLPKLGRQDVQEGGRTPAEQLLEGTQAPTIYRRFGDKDGLLAAVLEYGFAAYLADKPSPEPGADPIADLRAGWDLRFGFGLANPALFRLMYTDSRPGQLPAAALAGMEILRTPDSQHRGGRPVQGRRGAGGGHGACGRVWRRTRAARRTGGIAGSAVVRRDVLGAGRGDHH